MEEYQLKRQAAFPKFNTLNDPSGVIIGVYYSGALVGGATLTLHHNMLDDSDIANLWESSRVLTGIRISRLWAINCQHESPIPHIFGAILASVPDESFLYGILSLPLNYARSRKEMFFINNDWLKPRYPLEDCNWEKAGEASSEGRRLFKTYLSVGAHILGPVSGDPNTHSVKVVMGMNRQEVLGSSRGILHA